MARYCDIVMKGGITSGVVYPAAVVEMAKSFVFKNIGGTSAGAIAAALTAAAERRRARDGSTAGFDRLGAIPDWLATDDRLFRLFVPNASTTSLFRTVVGLFGRARFQPAAVAKWCGLVWAYPIPALLGAIPGVACLVTLLRAQSDTPAWLWPLALVIAALTIVAGISVAVAVALGRDILGKLPGNGYGLVTGIDDANRTSENALCTWLAREMELTAGLEPGTPLTFGMLWRVADDPAAKPTNEKPSDPDVNLEMITTNVTWGRPYDFPITTEVFFFDPAELKRYFPDYVVDWMEKKSRAPRDAKEAVRFAACAPKRALPLMSDLPVIVATRMSLAFPILLSAVPLWAADFSLPPASDGQYALECVWFSDGGISSNFPITLFDSPLPRWPTFAINLGSFPPGRKPSANEAENVYMIKRNSDGRLPAFNRFSALPGFLSAIFNAVQNWNDNTQSMLPGYRDRIVTVLLDSDEGGLNLDMPPTILNRLKLRGAAAGTMIAGRFVSPSLLPGTPGQMDWQNHRWLRFRSTMGALKTYLGSFSLAASRPQAPDVTFDALVNAADGTPVHTYPIPPEARTEVSGFVDRLATLGTDLDGAPVLDDGMPKPPLRLVLRGSLSNGGQH